MDYFRKQVKLAEKLIEFKKSGCIYIFVRDVREENEEKKNCIKFYFNISRSFRNIFTLFWQSNTIFYSKRKQSFLRFILFKNGQKSFLSTDTK